MCAESLCFSNRDYSCKTLIVLTCGNLQLKKYSWKNKRTLENKKIMVDAPLWYPLPIRVPSFDNYN